MRRPFALTAIAALSIGLAACSSGAETPDAASPDAASAPAAATFAGLDTIAWETTDISVAAGSVELTITCGANANHALGIEGIGAGLAACDAGGSDTATADLAAGTYDFFCTIPGHREAGMEGTLTVG